jgi:hypothetical protein
MKDANRSFGDRRKRRARSTDIAPKQFQGRL